MRHDGPQQAYGGFQYFLGDGAALFAAGVGFVVLVEQFHHGGDGGVELLAAAVVVADFGDGGMQFVAQVFEFFRQTVLAACERFYCFALFQVFVNGTPQTTQEAVCAFDAAVAPFEGLFGWCGKHHKQAGGVRAVGVNQLLRIDAVVFGLGHFFRTADDDRQAVCFEDGGNRAAFVVESQLDIGRVDPVFAAFVVFTVVGFANDHALRQQAFKRFVNIDQAFVAHQFGEETRVQEVQNRVFDTADVLVDRAPVFRGFSRYHAFCELGRHVAEEIPARFHEGVHGVGFAFCSAAAAWAGGFVKLWHFCQRRTHAVGYDVFRQDDRQLVGRDGYVAAFFAMDDRNRATPVALARNTPVAQAVLGFRFACVLAL